jgi:hypothetical protein
MENELKYIDNFNQVIGDVKFVGDKPTIDNYCMIN